MMTIVQEAVEGAGGVVALARVLGIKHTSLYSWTRVPAGRVLEVEKASGISRHRLRPDIFGSVESEHGAPATSRPVPTAEAAAQGGVR